jgi:hypothetical protein
MAKLIKLDTKEYPMSVEEFKNRFPNTSFPIQIPFADFGYAVVFPVPQPAYDPATEEVREAPPRISAKGTWEQVWEIVPRGQGTGL